MNNIIKVWAGFPTSIGKSYYEGFAGNRATISLTLYRRKRITKIRPHSRKNDQRWKTMMFERLFSTHIDPLPC
ncbi:MAG: hypothetical protein ABJO27_09000 [Pseudoruegeria sp.]